MTKIPSDEFIASVKEVGRVFKFGTGILGKSAITMGILLIAVIVAVARLHSDSAIIVAIVLGCLVFIAWFLFFLRFAGLHPDAALLEGAGEMGGKRFEADAKGFIPTPADGNPPLGSGGTEQLDEAESYPSPAAKPSETDHYGAPGDLRERRMKTRQSQGQASKATPSPPLARSLLRPPSNPPAR